MISFKTECTIFLKVPKDTQVQMIQTHSPQIAGEVDSGSILNQKSETKSFWETKMLSVDEGGWEPVANVMFRSHVNSSQSEDRENAVPPPPEFSAESATAENSVTEGSSLSSEGTTVEDQGPSDLTQKVINERPQRQYVYGSDAEIRAKRSPEPCLLKPATENVIEAEIREQHLREEALRREKSGGASSPSSHASDEGFVERPIEEGTSTPPPLAGPASPEGFTHTIKGRDGESVIYDAVSPPSGYFNENSNSSEAKIALEIRELKEREAELRALRELREREQQLQAMKGPGPNSQRGEDNSADLEIEEEVERASVRDMTDDHLTSLTTTTDEGNYSECGDVVSSEDKSSDGSNSRMMSPELQSYGSHTETRQRKVTVKPFEDDETEQPVYTQMKKESVIEREIRLAKEREEAFRREKGLLSAPKAISNAMEAKSCSNQSIQSSIVSNQSIQSSIVSNQAVSNGIEKPTSEAAVAVDQRKPEEVPKRGVQHRLATSRIQQEIEETAQRERELRSAGKIMTLSEDTVDSKVTRVSDFASSDQNTQKAHRPPPLSSTFSCTTPPPTKAASCRNLHTPLEKRNSSPVSPNRSLSPYSPPNFTPSPGSKIPINTNASASTTTRLTRSLSTNNLSLSGVSSGGLRPPQKGLMQKFIASRGKMTTSTFSSPLSPSASFNGINKNLSITSNGVPTRPMRVTPKTQLIRREIESKTDEEEQTSKIYRRTHATAEEKIQEELRDMKKREEELRRIRARNMARSQPNLAAIEDDANEGAAAETDETADEDEEQLQLHQSEGVDSSSFLHEMNGLRSALSNPNLLDHEPQTQVTQAERGTRRRSALIAQWEGRIQQTAET